jgi:hypothetical protein
VFDVVVVVVPHIYQDQFQSSLDRPNPQYAGYPGTALPIHVGILHEE